MPCDCELDLARRWVRCRAWGTVTCDQALATRRKFASDPNFALDFHQIYDATEVTRIAITASEIGMLARDDVFGPGSRRALVAPSGHTYSFGRTFQLYRQMNSSRDQIRLFRNVADAEAWLNS
jgi:hypothetical protein